MSENEEAKEKEILGTLLSQRRVVQINTDDFIERNRGLSNENYIRKFNSVTSVNMGFNVQRPKNLEAIVDYKD